MSEQPSAWKALIDEWVARELRLHPDAPIRRESLRVRDTIEVDDHAYVLISYDIDHPWPEAEDAPGSSRTANTAVVQAVRVRQPWLEKDSARALGEFVTEGGGVRVFEHVLGSRRALSGYVEVPASSLELRFAEPAEPVSVSLVDGWFLAVAPEAVRLTSVAGTDGRGQAFEHDLHRRSSSDFVPEDVRFARSASQTMYFSPLDLRSVTPIARWERAGHLVVVASSIERYDDGGILRLRIDGIRSDDDLFVAWPKVSLVNDGAPVASAVCGEYAVADTVSLDIGFKPWIESWNELKVVVDGLRGPQGVADPIEFSLAPVDRRP